MRLIRDLAVDARVLTFAAAVTAVSIVIFGGIPAVHMSVADLMPSLKAGFRSARVHGTFRGRRLLITLETALALVLLTGAGLLVNSFLRLQRVELGFEPGQLVEAKIQAPKSRFPNDQQAAQFFDQAVDRIRSIPGVAAAATADVAPLSGAVFGSPVRIEGLSRDELVDTYRVAVGYFETLGVPLARGRMLARQDDLPRAEAAVINETMAKRYWNSAGGVGRVITVGKDTPVRVVGVVRDARSDIRKPPAPTVYLPYDSSYRRLRFRTLIARTLPGHGDIGPSISREVAVLDPSQTIRPRPLQESLEWTNGMPRFYTLIYGAFAAVGLLLAAVGVAGVTAQNVIRRTHEIGVRLALGARPRRVVSVVVQQILVPVVAGVVAGLAGAWAMAQSLASLLFDITPHDPITFACVAGLLVMVSLVAAWLPARRAATVNPIDVLRAE